jgi:hypothetical protein
MTSRVHGHRPQAARPAVAKSQAPQPQAPKPQAAPARPLGHSRRDSFEAAPRAQAAGKPLTRTLREDTHFQQLPRGTQARLLATARRHENSPSARTNIRDLALSQDFHKLAPREQRAAIQSLRKGLHNKDMGEDLAQLAGDKDFRHLSKAQQRHVIEAMGSQRGDRSARQALGDLASSGGFRHLNGELQEQLVDELGTRRKGTSEARFGEAALQLAESKSFRRLAPEVERQLAKAIAPGRPQTQETREALVAFGTEPGLARLPASTQRQLMQHLPPHPRGIRAGIDHLDQLSQLVRGGALARLRPELQPQVLDAIRPGRLGPDDENTLVQLAASPGFASLAAPEQDWLLAYVSGTNPFSSHVRGELGARLEGKSFRSGTPAAQAEQLRTFLREQPGVPGLVAELPGSFQPRPFTLTGPQEVAGHPFASGKADALRYEVEIEGQRIPVFVAKNPDPSKGASHSIEEVATGLATLPPACRALVNQVNVNAQPNPFDAYWAEVYGQPDFRSYMTAGSAGTVDIYPSATKQSQEGMNASLIHETGHVLSGRHLGDDPSGPRWDRYKAAIASDGLVPSNYARSAPTEDFAETLVLYQKVRGTPHEAEVRALMPARFQFIDGLLAAPAPSAAPLFSSASAARMGRASLRA